MTGNKTKWDGGMQHSAGIQTDCIAHFLRFIIGVCQIMLNGGEMV